LTLDDLTEKFLKSKQGQADSGELSPRLVRDYSRTCDTLIGHFGKDRQVDTLAPEGFGKLRAKLAKRLAVVSLKNRGLGW